MGSTSSLSAEVSPMGPSAEYKASSDEAKENDMKEADLLFVRYASSVFETFGDKQENVLFVNGFQMALTSFGIYMSLAQASSVVAMFLRDIGDCTPLDERRVFLTFSKFTRLLINIDGYQLNVNKFGRMHHGIFEHMRSRSPTQRCDLTARFVCPVAFAITV